jgi:uncharacterized protein (TIGR02145 family)
MSNSLRIIVNIIFISGIIYCNSCSKDIPVVSTTSVSGITQTSAISGGNVTNNGGADVTARGICWGTAQNPSTTGSKTSDGKGNGAFTSNLTGLMANTTYYVCAYATNSEGSGYGLEISFTTLGNPPVAEFTASQTIVSTGQSVQFTDQSTYSPTSWSWNFGDGNTSTLQNPSHTYSTPGTYTVSLTVTNSFGSDTKSKSNYITILPQGVLDADGNVYGTVTIGTQVWMTENLKTTKLNDNTVIPIVTNATSWSNLISQGCCWYDNDQSYKPVYGLLYNWYAVNSGKLCPAGWHVPNETDWTTLTDYLGGSGLAGGLLKEAGTGHWLSPNTGATNSSGFTALPGGGRGEDGIFGYLRNYGNWWESTEDNTSNAWYRGMHYNSSSVGRASYNKKAGFSVRCIKD